ncbi:MAG: hypothetical protein A2X86_00735 [Bdellovibrionales bacterium GWA2_49_15]|nr:MAG: hypothetical protein A2X86_00735 [Bdellovibrionales bacterium GWA2_49_15]HAZ14613.1 chemotaxis protein CheA [Bdellovibrionales bacterium]
MTDEESFLIELQESFLQEASDLLVMIEESFMHLENDPADKEELEKVFRLFHNIKGTASAVGFDDLSKLCHTTENLLSNIRTGKTSTGAQVLEVLLKACDAVVKTVDALKKNNTGKFDYSEITAELKGFIEAGAPKIEAAAPIIMEIDDKLLEDFLSDANDQMDSIDASLLGLEHHPEDHALIDAVFRGFHTMKSGSSIMGFKDLEQVAHIVESILDEMRAAKAGLAPDKSSICLDGAALMRRMVGEVKTKNYQHLESYQNEIKEFIGKVKGTPIVASSPMKTEEESKIVASTGGAVREGIKVDADKLDRLIDCIGELVISETMVSQSEELGEMHSGRPIRRNLDRMGKITRNLQEIGMSLRMIPIRQTFKKMNRLVRDLSKKMDKEINLEMTGEDTELDKNVADKIGDPLVHMVRNAIDHGIEKSKDDRLRAGKAAAGTIILHAFHKGGNVCIEIKDDGRGLDPEKLLAKGREKGIVGPEEHLSQSEIFDLIFHPGFSTAEKVTDVSGRGVGMDVVRRNIEEIHGQVEIDSTTGAGSTFTIKIPNTLAIIEGMVITVGNERYVIPTYSIIRSFRPTGREISTVSGGQAEMLNLSGESIPLFRLGTFYRISNAITQACEAIILIVEDGGRKIGLMVDQIIRQQQFVIKPLTGVLSSVPGISGGTIMPDGQVGLILDVTLLFQHLIEKNNHQQGVSQRGSTKQIIQDAGQGGKVSHL